MRKLFRLPLAAGAAVTLGACVDVPTAPDLRVPERSARDVASAAGRASGEREVVGRFSLELEAAGPFVPGRPIRLTATTTNHLDARRATVSFVLPEAAAARQNGWRHSRAKIGTRVAPDFAASRVIQRAARSVEHTVVTFGAPGLYSVTASVHADADAPVVDQGRFISNGASKTIWILVDAKGGRVLPRFDAAALPAGAVTQPGPTMMMVPICDDPSSCDPPPGDPPPPPPNETVTIAYFNSEPSVNTWQGLNNATITVSDYPSGASYTGQVDSQGHFTAPCPANSGGTQRVVVTLLTPGQFQIQDYYSGAVEKVVDLVLPNGFCVGGGETWIPVTDNLTSWYHQQMVATVARSRSTLQISRGFVGVNFDRMGVDSISYYRTDLDEIVIEPWPSTNYTEYGRFTPSHEYGHALAEKSLSGARGGGCDSHSLRSDANMQCALSEGWADYHAAIVRRYELLTWYPQFLTNGWYHGSDGSRNESAVANFLLMMTSPDVTFGGGLFYPPSYAAGALRDCQVRYFGSPFVWVTATKTDELVWCFEGGVDSGVYPTYFPSRYTYPTQLRVVGQRDAAARPYNWSQAAIRATWLKSFYNVGP